MNKVQNLKIIKLKYKGKRFYVIEQNEIVCLPGFRFKADGKDYIVINKDIPKWKRQFELHRLITGRGLRDPRTGWKVRHL